MTQLIESFFHFAPFLFTAVLLGAIASGIWLVIQVKKSGNQQSFSISDQLYMKRNASRMRKMQLR
jgi:hypothetical protein